MDPGVAELKTKLYLERNLLQAALDDRQSYARQLPPPGSILIILQYRASIAATKAALRELGTTVADAAIDSSNDALAELSELALAYRASPALAAPKFIQHFGQKLEQDKAFVSATSPISALGFLGFRETWFEMQSIALVEADDLDEAGLAASYIAYLEALRDWRAQGLLTRAAKKNGLLLFIFGQSRALAQMETIAKLIASKAILNQRYDDNKPLDSSLSISWLLDLGRREIFSGSPFAGKFPPTISIVYPGKCYIRRIMRHLDRDYLDPQFVGRASEFLADAERERDDLAYARRIINCSRAVAHVSVPLAVGNRANTSTSDGTGWLVGPNLLLTCWHVISGRLPGQVPPTAGELAAQVENTRVTFDYTDARGGASYGVEELVCYDAKLDYALLRLIDRQNRPLHQRGQLRIKQDVGNTGTPVYLIQHPIGQPQQYSYGHLAKLITPEAILHTASAASSTSGAPLLSLNSWEVIGLHTAIQLAQGSGNGLPAKLVATPANAVLANIRQQRPGLL